MKRKGYQWNPLWNAPIGVICIIASVAGIWQQQWVPATVNLIFGILNLCIFVVELKGVYK